MQGMTFKEIEVTDVETYITDDNWIMEQKMDGTRVIAVLTDGRFSFLHRGGEELKHSAAVQHLPRIELELRALAARLDARQMTLDGELIIGSGMYHLFDVMELVSSKGLQAVKPRMPLMVRRAMLDVMGAQLDNFAKVRGEQFVHALPAAVTTEEKRSLWEMANQMGVEGVMVKHHLGYYQPGVRVEHSVKAKFVKTADVVVTAVDRRNDGIGGRETGSITFGVATTDDGTPSKGFHRIDDTMVRDIGKCSVIGKPHVEVGDVIEVAYLYWTGETTYQPRMIRVRDDKRVAECTIGQFPAYTRQLVTFDYWSPERETLEEALVEQVFAKASEAVQRPVEERAPVDPTPVERDGGPTVLHAYEHPQGGYIEVYADGSMMAWDGKGKRKKTSATPEKLAKGHGQWKPVTPR